MFFWRATSLQVCDHCCSATFLLTLPTPSDCCLTPKNSHTKQRNHSRCQQLNPREWLMWRAATVAAVAASCECRNASMQRCKNAEGQKIKPFRLIGRMISTQIEAKAALYHGQWELENIVFTKVQKIKPRTNKRIQKKWSALVQAGTLQCQCQIDYRHPLWAVHIKSLHCKQTGLFASFAAITFTKVSAICTALPPMADVRWGCLQ